MPKVLKVLKVEIQIKINKTIMKYFKAIFIITLLILTINTYSQNKSKRLILGRTYAEKKLKEVLKKKEQYNLIDNKKEIIKDSVTAVNIAETILFNFFDKETIIDERPYEIYHIDKHWIIIGTLPKGYKGGTFLIIIDATNCRVLKIIHGK